MKKIPLHNLFEDVLKLRDIDNPEDFDKLIAKLEAESKEEKCHLVVKKKPSPKQ